VNQDHLTEDVNGPQGTYFFFTTLSTQCTGSSESYCALIKGVGSDVHEHL